MKALVVAAHPDDEILGCGATMARLSAQGVDVTIAILGEGETSRGAEAGVGARLDDLASSARRAAAAVGVGTVHLHDLPDNRFDSVPLLEIVRIVEAEIAEVEPTIVFTHSAGDLNVDHGMVSRAVLTATRPLVGHPVQRVYAFEVASATDWAFQRIEPVFRPNTFVDVEATIDAKLRALDEYPQEMRAFPHPRSHEVLRAMAVRWGGLVGCGAAEAFELVRSTVGAGQAL